MKTYIIEIEKDEKGCRMKRHNNGFTVFEMLGMITFIQSELIVQAQSMNDNDIKVKRTFSTPHEGKIEMTEDKVDIEVEDKDD